MKSHPLYPSLVFIVQWWCCAALQLNWNNEIKQNPFSFPNSLEILASTSAYTLSNFSFLPADFSFHLNSFGNDHISIDHSAPHVCIWSYHCHPFHDTFSTPVAVSSTKLCETWGVWSHSIKCCSTYLVICVLPICNVAFTSSHHLCLHLTSPSAHQYGQVPSSHFALSVFSSGPLISIHAWLTNQRRIPVRVLHIEQFQFVWRKCFVNCDLCFCNLLSSLRNCSTSILICVFSSFRLTRFVICVPTIHMEIISRNFRPRPEGCVLYWVHSFHVALNNHIQFCVSWDSNQARWLGCQWLRHQPKSQSKAPVKP